MATWGERTTHELLQRGDTELRRLRVPLGTVPEVWAFVRDGRRPAGRGFLWFVTVTNVLLGAALAAGSAWALAEADGTGWAAGVAIGLAWVAVGVGVGVLHLRRPGPADGARVDVATVEGRPAVVLPPAGTVPWVQASGTTAVAAALVTGAVAAHGSGGAVLLWLAALPVLVCVPDLWLRARHGGRLVLSREGLHLHAGDGAGTLAWDDVAGVRLVDTGRYVDLVVEARPDAPSWRWHRRRGVLPRTPRRPGLAVPLPLLDVRPSVLVRSLEHWARHPGTRTELEDDRGRYRLAEGTPSLPW
ncbi:hypothetical protein AB6N23_05075 [Cellulomonas sp. 179-A 9B4 NHS]|uniref:hypothetical protein n=1 Tax=Cellulomonas sp. 179-A 9B4 NHS TaxID=3142379 RepID=UPI0039A22FBF